MKSKTPHNHAEALVKPFKDQWQQSARWPCFCTVPRRALSHFPVEFQCGFTEMSLHDNNRQLLFVSTVLFPLALETLGPDIQQPH